MSKSKKTKKKSKKKANIVIKKERRQVIRPFFETHMYRLRNLGIAVCVIAVMLGGFVFLMITSL